MGLDHAKCKIRDWVNLVSITAWIDRAKPRSILCWTSPRHRGPWGHEGAGPTVDKSARFQVSFMIGLAGRKETCHMVLISSAEV
jgi:hypothetical protein